MTLWAVVEDYDNGLTWEDNCSHETLRRRVKEIEVGVMYSNVISDNILEDNCYY